MVARRQLIALVATGTLVVGGGSLASPPAARAFDPIQPLCTVAGLVNGLAQKACSLIGGSGVASTATTALTFAAVVAWAVGGARYVLHATAQVLSATTSPQLTSTWFSATYWRVAEIAALLTLPFLFAAALQALARSDLTLLMRAVFGYLPLAFLAVAIAAPLTMLLLSASDELSAFVTSAAGHQSSHFLRHSIELLGLIAVTGASPFVVFLIGLLTVVGALVLWMELLVREAAVYVIVLMLPLAFAALVWPARRIWAIRSIELLIALILSKFAIVAVLALGGAALDQSVHRSVTGLLAGAVLMSLAAFAPWAMLRLVPLAEIASAAAGSLSAGSHLTQRLRDSDAWAAEGANWATRTAEMRDDAGATPTPDAARATKEDADANAGEGSHPAPDASRPAAGSESEQSVAPESGSAPPQAQDNPGRRGATATPDEPPPSAWREEQPKYPLHDPPGFDAERLRREVDALELDTPEVDARAPAEPPPPPAENR